MVTGQIEASVVDGPWLSGGLPGELEVNPLIERDMLLCGLNGQGAM